MPFQSLPQELIAHMILHCDYLSILQFSSTCKLYYKMVMESSVIQLQLELEANGYQLSSEAYQSRTEGTAAQLLNEFKRYRDGWLYLRLGTPRLWTMDEKQASAEFQHGYFAEGLCDNLGDPEALPDTIKLTDMSTGATRITRPDLTFDDFLIDPSQDLLVLVYAAQQVGSPESTVHLCSLETGGPHDDTHYPDWEVNSSFPINRETNRMFIEVTGDLLAVRYISSREAESEILIWDWKRAILLNRIHSPGLSHAHTFLTNDSIILFQSIRPISSPGVNMLVYDNIRTPRHSFVGGQPGEFHASQYPSLVPHALFEFPAIAAMSLVSLWLKSDPPPTTKSSSSIPFLPLPETRVFQLSLSVAQLLVPADAPVGVYQVFIGKKKLLEYMSSLDTQAEQSQDPIRIPWDSWGEYLTRWFSVKLMLGEWVQRTHGTRFLRCGLNIVDEEEHITILDFHTPTVRRFSSLGCDAHLAMWPSKGARRHIDTNSSDEDRDYRLEALRQASLDQGERVYVDTIDEDVPSVTPFYGATLITRLPYRSVTWTRQFASRQGWLLGNNSIVALQISTPEEFHSGNLQTYIPYTQSE